jgi:hypothetical protein
MPAAPGPGTPVYSIKLDCGITYFVNARGFNNCAAALYRSPLRHAINDNEIFKIIGPSGNMKEYMRPAGQVGFRLIGD